MTATLTPPATQLRSRARLLRIEAGNKTLCAHCGDIIAFSAKRQQMQVICNVYSCSACKKHNGSFWKFHRLFRRCNHSRRHQVWARIEAFHRECYDEAERPYGDPTH